MEVYLSSSRREICAELLAVLASVGIAPSANALGQLNAAIDQKIATAVSGISPPPPSGSSALSFPKWNGPNDQVGSGYANFKAALDAQIARCRDLPLASGAKINIPGTYPGPGGSPIRRRFN